MARKRRLPHFESEEEELKFWETARIEDYEWEPAPEIIWDIRPEKKKRVTLRLEPSVIAELKEMAAGLDMPYQTLTRGLIRRGLRELQEAREAQS